MREQPGAPLVGETLGPLLVDVTSAAVLAYADASGDHNPIHIDAAFAASTPFGGPIAHGMLVLAYMSRVLTQRFGRVWVETGSLDARFRAPAMVGSTVHVTGEITAVEAATGAIRVGCAVRVLDAASQALVTATATLTLAELS
jgi:3-hydroxybutyryl-CoA dehydratase